MSFDITRRGAAAGALAFAAASQAAARAPSDPLLKEDATGLAGLIRRKAISPLEALEASIARVERLDGRVNALVTKAYDRARDQLKTKAPEGPFAGVPFLIKDLNDVTGLPTYYGSRSTGRGAPAQGQSSLIDQFERAGFVIFGKTNTPEFGYLPTTEPKRGPITKNPWNLLHSPGGSSGGAAAAVAAGYLPVAHANDGGGSIRIPASCCGLVGLKPSRARVIGDGTDARRAIDLAVNLVVSRSVRDTAGVFAAVEQSGSGAAYPAVGLVEGPSRRRLRIGLLTNGGAGAPPEPEVAAVLRQTGDLLRRQRHSVRETTWPFDGARFADAFTILWASGAAQSFEQMTKRMGRPPDDTILEPFSLGMANLVAGLAPGAVEQALATLSADARAYAEWFKDFDVVLSPVLSAPPPKLGFVSGDVAFETLRSRLSTYVGYTPVHNVAGAPAISLPLGWSADGLPFGMHFAAKPGDERTLLELAYEIERLRPWARRHAPVSAWRA
jgi:amidase